MLVLMSLQVDQSLTITCPITVQHTSEYDKITNNLNLGLFYVQLEQVM